MHGSLGDDAIESLAAGHGEVIQIGVRAYDSHTPREVLPGRIGKGVLELHTVGLARNNRPGDPGARARAWSDGGAEQRDPS